MESLSNTAVLLFSDNTLKEVRKILYINTCEEMDRAIDILDYWIKQQVHFTKKDFSRTYLERLIIRSKGSVERAKGRLDKVCTARTHLPYFYGVHCAADHEIDFVEDAWLPRLNKDYSRVYILKNWRKTSLSALDFQHYYQRMTYFMEYFCKYDYTAGVNLIIDYRDLDILAFVKTCDVVILQKAASLFINGYGTRLKSIHVISTSKMISLIVSLFKQVVSEKIGSRIMVHDTIDGLYDYIDKDILPKEYGGTELPLTDLYKNWLKELSSNDFIDHIKELSEAKVLEQLRPSDSADNEFSSVHGTFRSLTVD